MLGPVTVDALGVCPSWFDLYDNRCRFGTNVEVSPWGPPLPRRWALAPEVKHDLTSLEYPLINKRARYHRAVRMEGWVDG